LCTVDWGGVSDGLRGPRLQVAGTRWNVLRSKGVVRRQPMSALKFVVAILPPETTAATTNFDVAKRNAAAGATAPLGSQIT
jgi:hypothetical protein